MLVQTPHAVYHQTQRRDPLHGTEGCRYSHPIASALWIVGSAGTSLNHFATRVGDGGWLSGSRSMLRCWSSSRCVGCSMSAAWLLFFLLSLVSSSLCNGLSVLLVLVDSPVEDVV